jgi:secreted trypsin-like serine protease
VLVTAAHCAGSSAWASFGTKVSEPALIRVVKKVSHPKFARAKMQNDVALYLLEKEAPITHKPAKIFEGSVSEGDVMAVAGFGITKFRGKNDTGILRQADVFVKKINTDPTPEIILAGKNGEDTCQGDSGGPAYVWVENHYEVLGVTSWGNGCGVEGHYTDLRAHSTFIAETLASFEQ